MKRITRILFQILASFSLVALLAAWLAPTASAHVATPSNGPYGDGQYVLMHIVPVGNETWDEDAITIAPGTSANVTQDWSVSNSFGATITIGKDIVSAQLGYNVTQTTDVSETCSADVNTTDQDELLEWQSIITNYNYDIYWQDNFGNDTYQGTGWAKEYNGPRCALY